MSLFTEAALREAAGQELRKSASYGRTASDILITEARARPAGRQYDVFLSHSFRDADLVLGLRNAITDLGFVVYVDWIDDPSVDRKKVSPATAAMLRERMKQCRSLLYATSEAASESRWMPWELGYFDALRQTVAIVPITRTAAGDSWTGQEYLGLYPYITRDPGTVDKKLHLWVHHAANTYVEFSDWLKGRQPFVRS
jgi:hypothetical protein